MIRSLRLFTAVLTCAMLFILPFANATTTPARDYFARLKYNLPTAIALLERASGQPLSANPEAEVLLEDMGYWAQTRASGPFVLTAELKAQVEAQYRYLQSAFDYELGDVVWVKARSRDESVYGVGMLNHRAIVRDHLNENGTDTYLVEVLVDGPSQMQTRLGDFYNGSKGNILYYRDDYHLKSEFVVMTRKEIDQYNSPQSSLEVDNIGEVIDWKGDTVWNEKIEALKSKLVASGFHIDWTASDAEIYKKQTELLLQIFRHFKMNRNAPAQRGKGLGARSCGGGVCFDQALVLSFAIQALGQTQGLKAFNLDGTTINPVDGHGFVRVDIKSKLHTLTFDQVMPYEDWIKNKSSITPALSRAFESDDPMSALTRFASKILYKGYAVKTRVHSLISDPGWADYGVTPDQFARMPVTIALNPIPIDSNRAANGLSAHRTLADVSERMGLTSSPFAKETRNQKDLSAAQREELLKLFRHSGRSCSQLF